MEPRGLRPAISLCMIVKNEERHLAECLESVRRFVDEIIIVDTGSTDATCHIARSFGAQVFSFPWVDDFAAARNESLRHATGDWIISLDADERLNCCGDADCLHNAASQPGVDAWIVPIRNHRSDRGEIQHIGNAIRFFRRYPGIGFVGAAHEQIQPFLEQVQARFARAGFVIEHLGYDVSGDQMDRKLERNLSLLAKHLEHDPEDAYTLYCLGVCLLHFGRREESLAALQRALHGRGLNAALEVMTLNALGFHHLSEGRYALAMESAWKSLSRIPLQNTARMVLGLACFYTHDYRSALPHLLKAYQFLRLPPEKRQTDLSAELSIADPHLIKKLIAISYAQQGNDSLAISFFRLYLTQRPDDGDAHRLLGTACVNAGDFALGVQHLERARALGMEAGSLALPLAYAFFQMKNFSRAEAQLLEAVRGCREGAEAFLPLLRAMVRSPEYSAHLPQTLRHVRAGLREHASPELVGALIATLVESGHTAPAAELLAWLLSRGETSKVGCGILTMMEACFARNRFREARGVLETLDREHPHQPMILEPLGILCIKLGDHRKALEVFRALHAIEPHNPLVMRRLAGLYVQSGDHDSARRCLAGIPGERQ